MNLRDDLLASAIRALVDRAEHIIAERDAALALLKRAHEVLSTSEIVDTNGYWSATALVKDIVALLAGR